ncbi:MAG: branched-chain amino acid aminotransferase [Chloroflexi bacterium]|nr:branched-chain amino acid aminotransferase [Chloroflexota bacterium]MCI0575850.1 branched-chain amino acid aminotransferase [Chloroflexota bacterium]MCI0646577.1 branched-chain amino acid aminotransferase [Chloroflexota bacterium]MCI0726379.1 branched-chain amino acid aminotransferase [Chloroflexota bacterium]
MDIKILPLEEGELKEIPNVNLGFGRHMTNRMFTQKYTPERGWHEATIGPYRPICLDPATVVFHYAQEIFEGTKAYRRPDGHINIFRTWENMKRFNASARRMAMPVVDEEEHLAAIIQLISLDHEWVPSRPGTSLYIRPVMLATEVALGVHSSREYLHFVILSPVGAYFKEGFSPVSVYIEHNYRRAAKGGTGAAKTGGNYAASLLVGEQARARGYSQVLWLDAAEGRYIEEVGAMNICFVYDGKHVVTPPLTGSILPGVTRDSVITLARDLGYTVSEEMIDVYQMLADVESGKITEAFGCGTAAVIAPVGKFGYRDKEYPVNNFEVGPVSRHLYQELTDIQYGRIKDRFNWTYLIEANGAGGR